MQGYRNHSAYGRSARGGARTRSRGTDSFARYPGAPAVCACVCFLHPAEQGGPSRCTAYGITAVLWRRGKVAAAQLPLPLPTPPLKLPRVYRYLNRLLAPVTETQATCHGKTEHAHAQEAVGPHRLRRAPPFRPTARVHHNKDGGSRLLSPVTPCPPLPLPPRPTRRLNRTKTKRTVKAEREAT